MKREKESEFLRTWFWKWMSVLRRGFWEAKEWSFVRKLVVAERIEVWRFWAMSWGMRLSFLDEEEEGDALGNGVNLGEDKSNAAQLGMKFAAVGFELSAEVDDSFGAILRAFARLSGS